MMPVMACLLIMSMTLWRGVGEERKRERWGERGGREGEREREREGWGGWVRDTYSWAPYVSFIDSEYA